MPSDRQIHPRPISAPLLTLLALAVLAGCARGPKHEGDAAADWIAHNLVKLMGGEDALADLRFLSFDFVVRENGAVTLRRSHLWDRRKGYHRLEELRGNQLHVTLMDVDTREGASFVQTEDGFVDTTTPESLAAAFDSFTHDTHWLLAATRLLEPGTKLEYLGQQPVADRSFETLKLSFIPGDELTPQDAYWFHLSPEDGLPWGWSVAPDRPDATPTVFQWTEWQEVGDFKLPVRFEEQGAARQIVIDKLYSPADVRTIVFAQPDAPTGVIPR
ncbi:MAG TPA: hypothetical protein PLS90_10475 [Candidatus Sumerlaeota bacterium]|nr:MAG: hypothetical protein BWZ08_02029 [candidate division BRC1 bacterium ADurb.BinA292]HOE96107.1 hypothetical protein [Candidatus Sumerlaeota bacterium]HOR27023.1 hypothetical protein [Candidatus Sumerlaeota bacterium]HPK02867.1 hypothetical protein [Candidatus Sumerlaeota bacterium]